MNYQMAFPLNSPTFDLDWGVRVRDPPPSLPSFWISAITREQDRKLKSKTTVSEGNKGLLCTPQLPKQGLQPKASIHHMDLTMTSGKVRGSIVYFMISSSRCWHMTVLSHAFTPNLEHLKVKCQLFYLPREFSAVTLTPVYILPQVDTWGIKLCGQQA